MYRVKKIFGNRGTGSMTFYCLRSKKIEEAMILFNDLLHAHNIVQAVDDLVTVPRRKMGLPLAYQVGLVVPSIPQTIHDLEKIGFGPFLVATGKPIYWRELGKEKQVEGKMALSVYQNMEIEILEPTNGSEFYAKSVHPQGKAVLHHIGFLVDEIDTWIACFQQHGLHVQVEGRLELGRMHVDFAYMDNFKELGFLLELICNPFVASRR